MDEVLSSLIRYMSASSVMEIRMMNAGSPGDARLTFKDVMILNLIATTEECTPSKLASMLCVSKPTITARLNGLEDRGYIRRARSDEDGRVHIVELSPRTVDVYRTEWGIFESVSEGLRERFGDERMAEFSLILDEASRLMSAHGRESDDHRF